MDETDILNSSDVEFDLDPGKKSWSGSRNPGQASINLITKNAAQDRLSSKKTVKSLQFGHGAPATRRAQELWVAWFNAFRTHTLKKSLKDPFSGDDMVRFLDAIIGKLRTSHIGKPAPSSRVINHAVFVLASYGSFTYAESAGYKLTAQDGRKLETFMDDAIKEGRLIKGK